MFRTLSPDSERFRAAYPDWLARTAELMALSGEGTTFGIFGPWGSGKTSAIKGLQQDLIRVARVPLLQSGNLAVAYVDCSGLRSTSAEAVPQFVQAQLSRAGVVDSDSLLEKHLFAFFRRSIEISKAIAPDALSKGGLMIAAELAERGQKIGDKRRASGMAETASHIEKAFILLDDLDRCDADTAWAILRHARHALPRTKVVVAIGCDPVVLGHHISHVLGVPLASGFQAVLKYIDVPLKIPTRLTEAHKESIRPRILPTVARDWMLSDVACDAVGSIPMRDILAALPQACMWLESWDSRLRPTHIHLDEQKCIAEVVFFCALLHTCIPSAAQLLTSGHRDRHEFSGAFRNIAHGYTGPMKESTQTAIQREFGAIVQQVVEGRMDLVRYGRSRKVGDRLTSLMAGDGDVWCVLYDMLRS